MASSMLMPTISIRRHCWLITTLAFRFLRVVTLAADAISLLPSLLSESATDRLMPSLIADFIIAAFFIGHATPSLKAAAHHYLLLRYRYHATPGYRH